MKIVPHGAIVHPMKNRLTRTLAIHAMFIGMLTVSTVAQELDVAATLTQAEATAAQNPLQAMALYRKVLLTDPSQTKAYDALLALAEKTPLPREEKTEAELAASFGENFKTLATRHFLIVHDTETVWTENRGQLLEPDFPRLLQYPYSVFLHRPRYC